MYGFVAPSFFLLVSGIIFLAPLPHSQQPFSEGSRCHRSPVSHVCLARRLFLGDEMVTFFLHLCVVALPMAGGSFLRSAQRALSRAGPYHSCLRPLTLLAHSCSGRGVGAMMSTTSTHSRGCPTRGESSRHRSTAWPAGRMALPGRAGRESISRDLLRRLYLVFVFAK